MGQNIDAAGICYFLPVTGGNRSGFGGTGKGGGGRRMAAPDERRSLPAALPEPRTPAEDRAAPKGPGFSAPSVGPGAGSGAAWFSYTASGDQIVWSAPLRAMLGHPPTQDEVSRKVLARYVHRDDHAKALGAITRTW